MKRSSSSTAHVNIPWFLNVSMWMHICITHLFTCIQGELSKFFAVTRKAKDMA